MKTIIKTLFFFLLVTQICFAQWFYQSPIPTLSTCRDVYFIDANTGWAVGDKIIKTTDGGNNWIVIDEEGGDAIFFTDANNGWVAGYLTLLRTKDGGNTWTKINYANNQYDNLSNIYFVDSNNGYIVGFGWIGGDCGGKVLKTTDGGNSWSSQITDSDFLQGVHFTDLNNGWAVGDKILKTTDSGQSWQTHFVEPNIFLGDVFFIDSVNGWTVGHRDMRSGILKTTDGGENWIPQFTDSIANFYFYSVCFTDANNGVVVGISNNNGFEEVLILRTTNGGHDWRKHFTGIVGWWNQLRSVCFPNANVGVAVGGNFSIGAEPDGPIILRTEDGGENWFNQIKGTSYQLNGIASTDENTAIAVGCYGTVMRTTNGGNSWIRQSSGIMNDLHDVCFIDATNGWAVGEGSFGGFSWDSLFTIGGGAIIRTTDGGNSWITQSSGTTEGLFSVSFTDSNTGWAVGWNGIILKTTDGGNKWISQSSGTTEWLKSVYFADSNIGWTVGLGGTILKTTDGGNNWITQSSGATAELNSVYFTDSNTGWVVGGGGKILKTTNGGTSWMSQSSGTTDGLNSVYFTDSNTGWAVGNSWSSIVGGIILMTTDGGNNWTEQSGATLDGLSCVCFASSTTGWAVGCKGTILKTTNGGVTFIDDKKTNEVPKDFVLYQNYPNPFNPTTTIGYILQEKSNAKLTLLNALGEEIAVLINEEQDKGYHKVEFNGSKLTSGVYFYQLKSGSFIEMKKMILLR